MQLPDIAHLPLLPVIYPYLYPTAVKGPGTAASGERSRGLLATRS